MAERVGADDSIAILISDFQMARDDQRAVDQVIVGIMGVIGVLIPLFAVLVSKTCAESGHPTCGNPIWPPIYSLFPLILATLFAYLVLLGSLSTLRSYYLRGLEFQLSQELAKRRSSEGPVLPSFNHLETAIASQRRGLVQYRMLFGLIYLSVTIFGTVVVVECLVRVRPEELQAISAIVYAIIAATLAWATYDTSFRGNVLWQKVLSRLPAERERTRVRSRTEPPHCTSQSPRTRSLGSYLILPRPTELVIKQWFLVGAFFVVFFLYPHEGGWLERLIVGYLAFEVFVYQGRYVLNDVRGLKADAEHSSFKAHTRLPVPPDMSEARAIGIALVAACIRIGIGTWIGAQWLDGNARWAFLAATAATLVTGILYDSLRDVPEAHAEQVFRMSSKKLAILTLVGTGYAVRILLGWCLAAPLHLVLYPMIVLGTAFCLFGTMFVAMTFTFQGLHLLGFGGVTHRANPCQPDSKALELSRSGSLLKYPHVGPLMVQAIFGGSKRSRERTPEVPDLHLSESATSVGTLIPSGFTYSSENGQRVTASTNYEDAESRAIAVYGWRLLLQISKLFTWINGSFVLATVFAAVVAASIAAPTHLTILPVVVLLAGLTSAASVVTTWYPIGFVGIVGVSITCGLASGDARVAVLGTLPLLAIVATYEVFRRMTLVGMEVEIYQQLKALTVHVKLGVILVIRILVGSSAAKEIGDAVVSRRSTN